MTITNKAVAHATKAEYGSDIIVDVRHQVHHNRAHHKKGRRVADGQKPERAGAHRLPGGKPGNHGLCIPAGRGTGYWPAYR